MTRKPRGRLLGASALVGALASGLLLGGCTGKTETQFEVAVTIHPLKTIVSALMGPEAHIATILPPGVSPHAYDPLPSAVRQAAGAPVLVAVDPDVDGWAANLGSGQVWWMTGALTAPDPHAWLDPLAVAEALPSLAALLCAHHQGHCSQIEANAAVFDEQLRGIWAMGSRLEGTQVVVSSRFLSAFSARFGLRVSSIIAPVEGVEPSPRDIERSLGAARGAGLILGQKGIPEHAAREVARGTGARYVALDPIGNPESARDYVELLTSIIVAIEQAP